ncbi:hypothetical protein KSB_46380 [Ktedonobacter robiniae]|uniref:Uncharacterized protein n=1 Tax=Ktedonobacter robiniae TaxID=2778365 RepID=A0ABQ3UTX8_9CHLR|nr:hypothetical protein KSB_46380 [Ktedonobacter robiniae]
MHKAKLSRATKFLLIFALALLLSVFAFSASTPQTYAASISKSPAPVAHKSKVQPHWSGGGCSGWFTYGPSTSQFTYKSCISGSFSNIVSNAYVTFTAQTPSLWSSCSVTISIRDDTARDTPWSQTDGCLSDARADGVYVGYNGPFAATFSSDSFHTYVSVTGVYNGKTISGGVVNSPELKP